MSNIIDEIKKRLETVIDPELGISIMELGLVYEIKENQGLVDIKMTLTSLGCPLFSVLEEDIQNKISQIQGVKEVKIELTFDPPWSKEKMTEKGKALLGTN